MIQKAGAVRWTRAQTYFAPHKISWKKSDSPILQQLWGFQPMSPAAGELGSRRVVTSSNISVMGRKPVKFNDLDGSEGRKKHGKKPMIRSHSWENGRKLDDKWWYFPKFFRRQWGKNVLQSGWKSFVTLIGKPLEIQQDCFRFACINYDLTATTTVSWKIQNGNGGVPSKMKDFRELPEVSPQKDQMSITSPHLC